MTREMVPVEKPCPVCQGWRLSAEAGYLCSACGGEGKVIGWKFVERGNRRAWSGSWSCLGWLAFLVLASAAAIAVVYVWTIATAPR